MPSAFKKINDIAYTEEDIVAKELLEYLKPEYKNRLKNIIASIFFIKLSVFPGNFIAFKVLDLSEMRQITKHAITPFWADLKVHKSC